MNDIDMPPLKQEDQILRLEQMLHEGLDDLKAGRVVSRDAMRREIDALFAEHAAKHSLPKRA